MDLKNEYIKELIEKSPLGEFTSFTITDMSKGEFEGTAKLLPLFKRDNGIAHGGYISYIADILMGCSSLTLIDPNKTIFTAEMKISFLEIGYGNTLMGKATTIRSGRNVHFNECEIYGEKDGKRYLCAKASATMMVVENRQ